MTRVLAFVDDSECAHDVVATADALARVLNASVDLIHVDEGSTRKWSGIPQARHVAGDVIDVLRDGLDEDDVVVGVLGVRARETMSKPIGHVAEQLCLAASKPIVIVPPGSGQLADPLVAVVPLDGSEATAHAVRPVVELLQDGGAVIVSVHAYDHVSLPPLMSSAEDVRTLAAEFDAVHLRGRSDSVEFGVGVAEDTVADLVQRVGADAVIVAWGQKFEPGRAAVIRRLIDIDVRIVLVPVPSEV